MEFVREMIEASTSSTSQKSSERPRALANQSREEFSFSCFLTEEEFHPKIVVYEVGVK